VVDPPHGVEPGLALQRHAQRRGVLGHGSRLDVAARVRQDLPAGPERCQQRVLVAARRPPHPCAKIDSAISRCLGHRRHGGGHSPGRSG
jgi:hypothetical protein